MIRTMLVSVCFALLLVSPGFSAQERQQPELPNRVKAVKAGASHVDVSIEDIAPDMVASVSDNELWTAIQQAADAAKQNGWKLKLGLREGESRTSPLQIQFNPSDELAKLLTNDIHKFDQRKPTYSLRDYVVITPKKEGVVGNKWRVPGRVNPGDALPGDGSETQPEEEGEEYQEGCCGILTTMFSLTNRMGKEIELEDVSSPKDVDGDGRDDGLFWNPEALKDLWQSSGDTGDRGMSNEAVRQAHMSYNPSGAAPVTSATGQFIDALFESAEGGSLGYVDCGDFKVMADDLRKRLIADQDVCLYIDFDDGAHVAPLLSIEVVEGPPCTITFTVARTSVQGNGKNFDNIPVNPGTTTYTLTNPEDKFYSISSNTDFPGSVVTGLYVDAFERQ